MMRTSLLAAFLLALPWAGARAASVPEAPADVKPVKIRPKMPEAGGARSGAESRAGAGLNAVETGLVDVPTAAVLDYGGYSSQTRFYSHGGLLEWVSFGVYPRLNLGASLAVNGLIGNDTAVRIRPPEVQVKYRFFDGDRLLPALGVGYDGQGFDYSPAEKRFHDRQRGFFLVATQELGLPGLQAHPSFNISDFDSNSICGAIPLSYNIRDKAQVFFEWDNINDFNDSRVNSGLRVYLTPKLRADFAVRRIGQGGVFSDNTSRGPERVVQLKYTGSF